jgi:serine/threonine protein kinase
MSQDTSDSAVPTPPPAPRAIGPYRVLSVLGSGGMGTVYVAEQREPVKRRVAIKVIKLGLDSREVLKRFALERQALAVMNHPNVARVFEAGATDGGQPYFVMEYVEGLPIDVYCDKHRLDLKERVELFREVCAGVQHAHHKGIIHRDLKPANVLIARDNERPTPKIIDFGLARATDRTLAEHSLFTEQGQLLGTPEYMSPEQADMDGEGIDTRTDVYSLGVLLYQLLTGTLPFPSNELRSKRLPEIQRLIREVDPPRPSATPGGDAQAAERAQKRGSTEAGLVRGLRGDLDWVVMRAMAKEPERRYATPDALSDDLGRYLSMQPVSAGPPSTAYRLRKWLRRYRIQATAAAAVLLALIGGVAVATWQARRARSAELVAEENAREAERSAEEARAATALAERRAAEVEAEKARVELANERIAVEKERAESENRRFRLVRHTLDLADAEDEFADLHPDPDTWDRDWNQLAPDLERWLESRGEALVAARIEVQHALDELRARALPPSAAEQAAIDAWRNGPVMLLQGQLACWRRATALAAGRIALDLPDLGPVLDRIAAGTEGTGSVQEVTPGRMNDAFAWPRVAPTAASRKVWGEEDAALVAAREAVSRTRDALSDESRITADRSTATKSLASYLDTLAWASAWNGLLDEARAASAEAYDLSGQSADYARYKERVEALCARLEAGAEEELAACAAQLAEAESAERALRSWEFEDDVDRFLFDTLVRFEEKIEAFEDGSTGTLSNARWRLDWAERVEGLTAGHPGARVTWEAARSAIAQADGVVASSRYAAAPIDLRPQQGLVPIGMNPRTKLWEFYHLRSAWDPRSGEDPAELEIPRHDPQSGTIDVGERTGIVFVLIPGGTFTMGAQAADPDGSNYDPWAQDNEAPREVALAPFFLARHELTQAQWLRLASDERAPEPVPPRDVLRRHGWAGRRLPPGGIDRLADERRPARAARPVAADRGAVGVRGAWRNLDGVVDRQRHREPGGSCERARPAHALVRRLVG